MNAKLAISRPLLIVLALVVVLAVVAVIALQVVGSAATRAETDAQPAAKSPVAAASAEEPETARSENSAEADTATAEAAADDTDGEDTEADAADPVVSTASGSRAPAKTPASNSGGSSGASSPADNGTESLQLPSGVSPELALRMYSEQSNSQASIRDLVLGRVASFEITGRTVRTNDAELRLTVSSRDGATRQGVMKLAKANDTWYFSSISRVGNDVEAKSDVSAFDAGILNTVLSEQTDKASTSAKLVVGEYRKITIGQPVKGHRSVTLPVVFSGPKVSDQHGDLTVLEHTEGGKKQWFIASFSAK